MYGGVASTASAVNDTSAAAFGCDSLGSPKVWAGRRKSHDATVFPFLAQRQRGLAVVRARSCGFAAGRKGPAHRCAGLRIGAPPVCRCATAWIAESRLLGRTQYHA